MREVPDIAHTRDNALLFFQSYTETHKASLKDKVVVDVSAGSGYIAHLFENAGAVVKPFDLFPEQNQFATTRCQKIDLQQTFPISGGLADVVICSETLEHLPNQYFFFQEVSRILKPGGIFLLTTPNASSLRSRFSQFVMESEHYSNPPPNEFNAFVSWDRGRNGYFNKLFISGVLRLRTLAALQHLTISRIHPSRYSSTSIFLLIFYPFIYFISRNAFKKLARQFPDNKQTYRRIFEINTSLPVLLSKHLILEFVKTK